MGKIDKIGVLQASLFIGGMLGIVSAQRSNMEDQIKDYQSQILSQDTVGYKQTAMRAKDKPIQVQTMIWEEAYQKMQDSLQKVGTAGRGYFEGSQMLKDSLKNAQLH